jgi:hypothetical protein
MFSNNNKSCLYWMTWKNIVQPARPSIQMWRIHIKRWIRKSTCTQVVKYSSLFDNNNGCTNAPQCYVIRILPVLFKLWQCLPVHCLAVLANTFPRIMSINLTHQTEPSQSCSLRGIAYAGYFCRKYQRFSFPITQLCTFQKYYQ